MKFPIIADEDGDILLFNDGNELSYNLEPVDVMNGAYMFWDAMGFKVEGIVTRCDEKPLLGIKWLSGLRLIDQSKASLTFKIKQPAENDEVGLMARLRKFIITHGGFPSDNTLEGLLHQALALNDAVASHSRIM